MKTKKIISWVMVFGFFGCAAGGRSKSAEQATLRYNMAQTLLEKGETPQALAELLQAEKLNPKDPEIQNLLGLVFANRGMEDDAVKHLTRSAELDPKYSEAQNNLCFMLAQQGKYEEALKRCDAAVANVTYATPERAYHNMGLIHERMGNRDKAIEAYKKGLTYNANFVMSRKSLGVVYLEKNQSKEAIQEFEIGRKACEASPKGAWGKDCSEVNYQLAMAYMKLRQRPKAVAAFKDCVKADEEGEYGQKCRANLKVLE